LEMVGVHVEGVVVVAGVGVEVCAGRVHLMPFDLRKQLRIFPFSFKSLVSFSLLVFVISCPLCFARVP
jgi:hypothetical protein